MKKLSIWSAIFCLFVAASAVFAQNRAASFAGTWELDVAKSKLSDRMRVASGTMTVSQTDSNLTVATDLKRAPRPEGEMPNFGDGGEMRSGGGRGGMMGVGGNGKVTYSLEGKQTGTVVRSDASADAASTTIMSTASFESNGKLKLTSSRSFDTPNGSMSIKTTDTWELLEGGNALRVTRETETPRGTQSSEMYFTKKDSAAASSGNYSGQASGSVDDSANETGVAPRKIAGGVLNGKALQLTKPSYPLEARESKASGAVNVQVTIDEQGNVVAAKAVSGDVKLRAASEEAARNSKFAPTMLSGVPVMVTGVIVYNFMAP